LTIRAETGDRDILARIHTVRGRLDTAREAAADQRQRAELKKQLDGIKKSDVRTMLSANAWDLREGLSGENSTIYLVYGDEYAMDRDSMRQVLASTVSKIVLDPKTREFRIQYRLPLTGVKMASPRGFEPRLPP
jgi:hypothetical protein